MPCILTKHLSQTDDPLAPKILEGLYVDNFVNSFDDENDLQHYFYRSRAVMQDAGFNLCAWKSSYGPLNSLEGENEVLDQTLKAKVLGLL